MKLVAFILACCVTLGWAQMMQPETAEEPLFPVELPEGVDEPECGPLVCDIQCVYGPKLGVDGCPRCECKTREDLCQVLGDCPGGHKCHVPTCMGETCLTVKPMCIAECPMIDCVPSPCDSGLYKQDENGCQTCDCDVLPPPTPPCPMFKCVPCESGFYKHDENGCQTCECDVPPPSTPHCPMFRCLPCESGLYKHDENGCQTCECDVPPPPTPACAMPMCSNRCPSGYFHDEFGCMTCECNPEEPEPMPEGECKPLGCRMSCEHGLAMDERGCDICKCRDQPEHCLLATCRMFCDFGFQKDERGCHTCKCRDEPETCPETSCLMLCEYGKQKDERGCDMCVCRSQPLACSDVMCAMFCEHGFEKDAHGCDMCKCRSTSQENVCATIDCAPDMTCHEVAPKGCPGCSPIPLCRPMSICQLHERHGLGEDEMEMLRHHLLAEETEKLYAGPSECQRDGAFTPRQCSDGRCFCVDDRGVIQGRAVMENLKERLECEQRISETVYLSFQLLHDMQENDLDGALLDIQALVQETVGGWMHVDKNTVFHVEVLYVEPGVLLVDIGVKQDGKTDLAGSSHHMHKKMRDGECDLHYKDHNDKDHLLRPEPDSVAVKHTYPEKVVEPEPERPYIATCWARLKRYRPVVVVACGVSALILLIIIITVATVATKRRRSASYQFRHKKMENMETFKKNLIMSSEWEKPELVCKDDVKVIFNDDVEKKPLA